MNLKVPGHYLVTLTSWASYGMSTLAQLVAIRLLVDYLGKDGFAFYVVIVSLLAWVNLAELGIGNSIRNYIAEYRANGSSFGGMIYHTRSIVLLILAVGFPLVVLMSPIVFEFISRNFSGLPADANEAVVVALLLFLSGAIGSVGSKILFALHKGYIANGLSLLSSMMGVVALYMVTVYVADSRLVWSVIAFWGPSCIAGLIVAMLVLFRLSCNDSDKIKQKIERKRLWGRARGFALFAALVCFVLQVDYIVMSQVVSPESIAMYAILFRLFNVPISLYNSLLQASVHIVTERAAVGDAERIHRMIKLYVGFGVLLALTATFIVLLLSSEIIALFAPGQNLVPHWHFVVVLGGYAVVKVWSDTYAMVLQALSETHVFLKVVPFQAVISLGAQLFFSVQFGILGIPLGMLVSFAFTVCWVLPASVVGALAKRENLKLPLAV